MARKRKPRYIVVTKSKRYVSEEVEYDSETGLCKLIIDKDRFEDILSDLEFDRDDFYPCNTD